MENARLTLQNIGQSAAFFLDNYSASSSSTLCTGQLIIGWAEFQASELVKQLSENITEPGPCTHTASSKDLCFGKLTSFHLRYAIKKKLWDYLGIFPPFLNPSFQKKLC